MNDIIELSAQTHNLKEYVEKLRIEFPQLKMNPLDLNLLYSYVGLLSHTVDELSSIVQILARLELGGDGK